MYMYICIYVYMHICIYTYQYKGCVLSYRSFLSHRVSRQRASSAWANCHNNNNKKKKKNDNNISTINRIIMLLIAYDQSNIIANIL